MVSPKKGGKVGREKRFETLPLSGPFELKKKKQESFLNLLLKNWWLVALLISCFFIYKIYQQLLLSKSRLPSFVKFNVYRIGAREFAAVGLSPLEYHWRTKYHHCHWVSSGDLKSIIGRLEAHFPGEHHDLKYEAVILNCLLRHETPSDLNGKLYFTIDNRKVEMYKEKANSFPHSLEPKPPFKHHVTFCSPPIHSLINSKRVYEWMEYHFYLGIDYAIFYDAGGINEEVLETLLPYEQQGLLEVRDVTSLLRYESWLYSQVMLINDCAYSTRYTSRWTLYLDLDEYFNADNPPPPEVKKATIELKQQELKAQAHWHRQVARMHRRHHQEKIAESASHLKRLSEVPETIVENGAEISHEKKILLEERQKMGGRTEEEMEAVLGAQKKQKENYSKLKSRKTKGNEKVLSVAERKEVMAARIKEQHKQLELLKQHRDHLEKHKEREKLIPLIFDTYEEASFISFGSLWWDIERCVFETEAKGSWAIQRMLYHWPHIYCTNQELYPRSESCLDYHGHRKYAVNPRKVIALQIHRPVLNESQGVDLDTTVAKLNHFQGLVSASAKTCQEMIGMKDPIVWWARGEELSDAVIQVQERPTARFAGYHFPGE